MRSARAAMPIAQQTFEISTGYKPVRLLRVAMQPCRAEAGKPSLVQDPKSKESLECPILGASRLDSLALVVFINPLCHDHYLMNINVIHQSESEH
jgi:hypothetical protein